MQHIFQISQHFRLLPHHWLARSGAAIAAAVTGMVIAVGTGKDPLLVPANPVQPDIRLPTSHTWAFGGCGGKSL